MPPPPVHRKARPTAVRGLPYIRESLSNLPMRCEKSEPEIGPTFAHERAVMARLGGGLVAGVDEAGRGPWAGPVIAAAVVLDPARIPAGLDDSKALTPARRAALFDAIMGEALAIGMGRASAKEIDRINILQASLAAMARAVAALKPAPAFALIDGNRMPRLACPGEAIVKGDGRCLSIAAASIVAKVTRDRLMAELDSRHPGYGWARNKGYGTREHAAALARLGPTPEHRRSFRPVAASCPPAPAQASDQASAR